MMSFATVEKGLTPSAGESNYTGARLDPVAGRGRARLPSLLPELAQHFDGLVIGGDEDVEGHDAAGGGDVAGHDAARAAVVGRHSWRVGSAYRRSSEERSRRQNERRDAEPHQHGHHGPRADETEHRAGDAERAGEQQWTRHPLAPPRSPAPRIARIAAIAARRVPAIEVAAAVRLHEVQELVRGIALRGAEAVDALVDVPYEEPLA